MTIQCKLKHLNTITTTLSLGRPLQLLQPAVLGETDVTVHTPQQRRLDLKVAIGGYFHLWQHRRTRFKSTRLGHEFLGTDSWVRLP
mmetsp:Transcript_40331/g.64938  ORF Transcript_40331/g.64938 Transcript_40331/m.64938 type:complete len:86 (-) Transcript_40331:1355-1612(-)